MSTTTMLDENVSQVKKENKIYWRSFEYPEYVNGKISVYYSTNKHGVIFWETRTESGSKMLDGMSMKMENLERDILEKFERYFFWNR